MYRVVIECTGVPKEEGDTAARVIAKEFAKHRPWHANVTCSYSEGILRLIAENDYDSQGLALQDEVSDCLSAHTSGSYDCDLGVISVTTF